MAAVTITRWSSPPISTIIGLTDPAVPESGADAQVRGETPPALNPATRGRIQRHGR